MLFSWLTLLAVMASGSAITLNDCPAALPRDKYLQVHGDSCFRFVLTHYRYFFDAERDCEHEKGTLALVKTFEVQEYLAKELVNTYGVLKNTKVWIGLNDFAKENQFVWEDGTKLVPSAYSNWAPDNGPRDGLIQHNLEDCVSIDVTTHKWHDHHCTDFLFFIYEKPYVCEYKVSAPATSPATTTSTTSAPATSPATTSTTSAPATSPATTTSTTSARSSSPATTSTAFVPSSSPETTTITKSTPSSSTQSSQETTVCPPFNCHLDCGLDGYALDPDTGCFVCDCSAY
ncbi:uncharacterized protein LOC101852455 [Aplysia californica]|uniref:Uncharacterized protein LOC101852455 n=1 Tax=Aplysia californica TaxID=6500 RepID=A0ABM0JG14_APLCA|nr:uncharacterized protein LOC101852455 [Aplysia californica]